MPSIDGGQFCWLISTFTDKKKGLTLDNYTNRCIQKAYANMWMLRRLAELGISPEQLLITYLARIRALVEQNVPLWMFGLTKKRANKIEKAQKIALYVI